MFSNYLRTAIRNLLRHKMHAALNLTGLSIGLACCLLIALYIAGELRYDRQHLHADRIWRVNRTFLDANGAVSLRLSSIAPPFAGHLQSEFPEIERITRFLWNGSAIRAGENVFQETNTLFADSNFFKVFTVPMLQGNPETALSAPWQVVLSEKTARRYFGDKNPLDQTIRLNNQFNFKVVGVFRDFETGTSHFYPEVLYAFPTLLDSTVYGRERLLTNFSNNSFYTYLLVNQTFDAGKMEARFPAFIDKIFPPSKKANAPKPSAFTQLHIQRLTDIHLKSHNDGEIEPGGDYARVRMFGLVALIILLIAGINYVNLSTAFSLARAREIGVRKATGALRSQIIGQFLSESVLLTTGATVLALGLCAAAIPLLKKNLDVTLSPSLFAVWYVPLLLLAGTLLTGFLAGLYPAFFLSSFGTTAALKGRFQSGKESAPIRKSLVVTQFGISVLLLVSTLVINRQLAFLQNKSLGLDKSHIVNLSSNPTLQRQWDAFYAELRDNPAIEGVCRSSRVPAGELLDDLGTSAVQLGDTMTPANTTLKSIATDMDFVQTYNIPLAAGRAFSRDFPNDTTHAWLLNEAAARELGWKHPADAIGKRLDYGGRTDCFVTGVLRDFHFESLHSEIVPMIFYIPRNKRDLFSISVKTSGNLPVALAHLERVWKKFSPDFPYDYTFLDEDYGRLYEAESRQGQMFTVFSGLAVLIACLGLFGLATFAAHQRTREIGVRKVLGASVAGITTLLAKDFLKLVAVAVAIATPLAYYFMHQWLADFAYRIDMQWWMFVAAGLAAVLIAFLTVSFQAVKAALANPVQSLRSE